MLHMLETRGTKPPAVPLYPGQLCVPKSLPSAPQNTHTHTRARTHIHTLKQESTFVFPA